MGDAIALRGVNKSFGSKVAVRDLDLVVPEGSLVGLIGPNGAGKTTTIRIVLSILFADSGDVSVLGQASAIESKDRIGYLPEERGLYKKMRVGPFLRYMADLKGTRVSDAEVRTWLDRVGLADQFRKKCEELSKGMQQKVQFLAAILHKPDLLILDEPFSGLDPVNARLLRALVDEQHAAGKTVIFSTHQMSQAEALCDRVVMIHQGRKVLDDTPGAIRARFTPRSVRFETAQREALGQLLGDVQRGAGALAGVAGVVNYQRMGAHAIAHLQEGVDASSVVRAVASAAPMAEVAAVRPSLEDVFIEIVQRDASDAERATLRDMMAREYARDASGD